MLKRILGIAPAVAVTGAVLLTGCATAEQPAPAPASGGGAALAASQHGVEPVNCGPLDFGDRTYDLIGDVTPAGRVGCTEAFNVIDEYRNLPADQYEGTQRNATVMNGQWSCATDGGSGPDAKGNIYCSSQQGMALHTELRV
ncbi:hypothetical protein [Saccharopolyspora taberi]|uniref:Lipoprotein n=1 Tax=Saccharopolyspora taberi TaxID=60895 RepID=A0ABN3VNA9_9PSEU